MRIEYDTRKNRVFQVRIEYDTRKNRVFRVWVGYRVPYSILTRKLEKNRVRMYGVAPIKRGLV